MALHGLGTASQGHHVEPWGACAHSCLAGQEGSRPSPLLLSIPFKNIFTHKQTGGVHDKPIPVQNLALLEGTVSTCWRPMPTYSMTRRGSCSGHLPSQSWRLLWNQLRSPRTRPHVSGSTHGRGCWFLPTVHGWRELQGPNCQQWV